MASDLIPAIWEGPFPAEVAGMRTLQPGDEHMVTEADLESSHWRRKDEPQAAAKTPAPAPKIPAREPDIGEAAGS